MKSIRDMTISELDACIAELRHLAKTESVTVAQAEQLEILEESRERLASTIQRAKAVADA